MGTMRGSVLSSLALASFLCSCCLAQTKFGGSTSGGSNNNKKGNTKFFTGNEGIDGGLIGFGLGSAAGAIGAPLLGGAASALLGGGNQGYNGGGCGRKKRSADGEERFFL